jgi:hypothetical protein
MFTPQARDGQSLTIHRLVKNINILLFVKEKLESLFH